jgi:hypothetical protein
MSGYLPNGQEGGRREPYPAEKVADKDHEHPPGHIVPGIERLEGMGLAIAVQHDVVLDLLKHLGRWQLIVRRDLAFKVLRPGLVDLEVRAWDGLA